MSLPSPAAHASRVPWDRFVLAGIVGLFGVLHFTNTATFASMMPSFLPAHTLLVWSSGVCELVLATGLLVQRTRKVAAFGLMALFIAVFPANINMALHPERELAGIPLQIPALLLWLRLPLQFVLIGWAYRHTRVEP